MPAMGGESGMPKMPSLGGGSMLLLMNLNDVQLSNLLTIHRSTDRDDYFHYWFHYS